MCHGAVGGAVRTKFSTDGLRRGGFAWLIAASGWGLSACSASSSAPPERGAPAGASGFVTAGNGAGGGLLTVRGDGGSTGVISVGNPGAGGAAGGPVSDAGTSSGRTPISIDGCSAG